MKSTETRSYGAGAKFLHWLMAALIVFMLVLGFCLDDIRGPGKFFWFQLHKSVGVTILLLAILRVIWRALYRAPPFPDTMTVWEKRGASLGHFMLYLAMFVMPLSGWIMVSSSSHNVPTILYGLIPWPNFPVPDDNRHLINETTDAVHFYTAFIFVALIVGHVAAAWKHHLFDRDDIILRMAPRFLHPLLQRIRGVKA